jgi:hypothetical protein
VYRTLRPEGPVTSWDSASVILWLNYLGLGIYAPEVKRWVKTGQQLLDASTKELEKELGIKVGEEGLTLGILSLMQCTIYRTRYIERS